MFFKFSALKDQAIFSFKFLNIFWTPCIRKHQKFSTPKFKIHKTLTNSTKRTQPITKSPISSHAFLSSTHCADTTQPKINNQITWSCLICPLSGFLQLSSPCVATNNSGAQQPSDTENLISVMFATVCNARFPHTRICAFLMLFSAM